mmetsp:Transcript_36027/g.102576  ORF Transcript_36027/g.102576 Transcript_36027/m.102576 type:complete len:349 (-) Transcript_36027:68-1114(-)
MEAILDHVDLFQTGHQTARSETWSRRSYNTGICGMRVDMINAWREEMRDQASVTIASLDNLMVVSALMLSCGFGFAVEGTFPPKEDAYDYSGFQENLLVVYSFMASLSLAFPFACLLMAMLARDEFDLHQYDTMEMLQEELRAALEDAVAKTREQGKPPPAAGATPQAIPRASSRHLPAVVVQNGPRARSGRGLGEPLLGVRAQCVDKLRGLPADLFPEEHPDTLPQDFYERLTMTRLVGKMKHFKLLYDLAQTCLRLGMLCSIVCCTVLLGLVFYAHFPESPSMWRLYSGLLAFSLLGVFAFSCASPKTQIRLLGASRPAPPQPHELPGTRLQQTRNSRSAPPPPQR